MKERRCFQVLKGMLPFSRDNTPLRGTFGEPMAREGGEAGRRSEAGG